MWVCMRTSEGHYNVVSVKHKGTTVVRLFSGHFVLYVGIYYVPIWHPVHPSGVPFGVA